MPLKLTFTCKTTRFEHERGRYGCPLVFPEPTGESCPIQHRKWPKGCITTPATSVGARIRHQLDRESDIYTHVYRQRTATERINSQAKELGIERPRLRNGQAIANPNTPIYVLINLRFVATSECRIPRQLCRSATWLRFSVTRSEPPRNRLNLVRPSSLRILLHQHR